MPLTNFQTPCRFFVTAMTSNDSRQKSRRKSERRSKERREIPYPFGSAEWLRAIQKEYLLWPKEDRRHHDRRSQDRRHGNRRLINKGKQASKTTPLLEKRLQGLLTEEEKQMLNELIQLDQPD